MDTNDSINQMASFTMVEQITSMSASNAKIAQSLSTSSAVSLIGRTVTYIDADGESLKTGKVERVSTSADGVSTLTVNGVSGIDPSPSPTSPDPATHEQGALPLMMRGMFAAISGLKNHQVMLDVTANNISNVNTMGYKSARVTFQDSLTQVQRGAAGPAGNTAAPTARRSASASASARSTT